MKINSRTIVISSSKAETPCRHLPGTRLEQLIAAADKAVWYFGLSLRTEIGCQRCKSLARKMDAWGPSKCREKRDWIVAQVLANAANVPLSDIIKRTTVQWLVDQALKG